MPDLSKNKMGPYDGLSLVMNLILGSAPMIIPHAFAAAGWLLSLIWILIITFLSFQSAE